MTLYDPSMTAYFARLDTATFRATSAVQGAWNTDEQHIAPALGLMTHIVEQDNTARNGDRLALARISFDILGVLPIDTVEIDTQLIRPGRSIQLVEATLTHRGRPTVIARAWYLRTADTQGITGHGLPLMPALDTLAPWSASEIWPGEYVNTVEVHRQQIEPGRAHFWMRPRIPLLENESISATARMLGLVDTANGITPRFPPTAIAFPNVDLTAHLFRVPLGDWIGFDTTVSFGPHGAGLTHTVLHDENGPIGTAQQTLTLRTV